LRGHSIRSNMGHSIRQTKALKVKHCMAITPMSSIRFLIKPGNFRWCSGMAMDNFLKHGRQLPMVAKGIRISFYMSAFRFTLLINPGEAVPLVELWVERLQLQPMISCGSGYSD